jgi:bla regulator protein blaR1
MDYLQVLVEWSNWIWRSAFNHLWQGTIFFLIAVVASLLMRRGSPRARYFLWLAASIKFAVPSAVIVVVLTVAGINLQSAIPSQEPIRTLQQITPVVSPLVVPSSYLLARNPELFNENFSNKPSPISIALILSLAGFTVWLLGAASFLWVWLKRRRQVSLVIQSGRIIRGGREWNALERVKSWLGITRRSD